MARQCTDIDEILRSINHRLRKLEKSDSEKTEEIGRLNRVICQKDKEIHNLKVELASSKSDLADAKTRIKELEGEEPAEGTNLQVHQKSLRRIAATAVFLHLRRALPLANFAGRNPCASRVASQAVDSLDTREAPCSLSVRQTES